jgi:ubiquitin carboxyl-terminal hydrolase 6/32
MSLWRLPPVVIIQLKRFQFTQHTRRKLRDFVHFPIEGLDLSRIMAGDIATNSTKCGEKGSAKKRNGQKDSMNGTEVTEDDSEPSPMSEDNGRKEMLYDLYGVVHHQGALSGGHYVASLKSDLDGQWRLFNDAQIYEIHSRDVVDSSAYILFYIRRDVKDMKLSDFWDVSRGEGSGLTEEEMDTLLRGSSDRCVIS